MRERMLRITAWGARDRPVNKQKATQRSTKGNNEIITASISLHSLHRSRERVPLHDLLEYLTIS